MERQDKVSRTDAENWIKDAIIAFEEFEDEEPLTATARNVFRYHLVFQFKLLVEKLMQSELYPEVGDVCRLWSCFQGLVIENQLGEGHALQLSDLAEESQIWKLE